MNRLKALIRSHRGEIEKLVKYVLTGGSAFAAEYAMFFVLTVLLRRDTILSNVIVYTVTFWFVFLANKFFTFKAREGFGGQLLKYMALYAFNLGVTNLLLWLLTAHAGLDKMLAKLIISALIVLWNFPLYRFVIYR